jgi:hypothetical protein
MALHLSERHAWVLQSEIRNMSIECDRVGGINLSQGVCDTEVPFPSGKVRSRRWIGGSTRTHAMTDWKR